MLHRECEHSDDEKECDFDGDEELNVDGDNEPRLTKILRLFTPMGTNWNSAYYLIKLALDPLARVAKSIA